MAVMGRSYPNPPVIVRSTLADPPVLTIPAPVIVADAAGARRFAATQGRGYPAPAIISVAPPIQAAPAVTMPAPLVVVPQPTRPQSPALVITRGALQDPSDFKGRQPLVVALAVKVAAAQPPIILRGSLADAPVLTTPAPLVIAAPRTQPPTYPVISSAPLITAAAAPRNATSAPLVTAVNTSAPTVSGPASGALVAARSTSSPGVSDG